MLTYAVHDYRECREVLESLENAAAVHAQLYTDVASGVLPPMQEGDDPEQMRQMAVMLEEHLVAASVAVCAKRH